MLAQGIAAKLILPIALEILESDPLLETEYYSGDLLVTVSHQARELFDDCSLQRLNVIVRRAVQTDFEACPDGLVDYLSKWCNEVASS